MRVMWGMLGSIPLGRLALGPQAVYTYASVYDMFNRPGMYDGPDIELDADRKWINLGPSLDYKAVIHMGTVRMGIPDGLSEPLERVSYMRCNTGLAVKDDGHLEFRVVSKGDAVTTVNGNPAYASAVFVKANNTLRFKEGIGLWLAASHISLVVRHDGVEYLVQDFGTFSAGDLIRMEFTGPRYEIFCRGESRGVWIDTKHTVASGPGWRSLVIRVHGGQESPGPRRFSPLLDNVEYS